MGIFAASYVYFSIGLFTTNALESSPLYIHPIFPRFKNNYQRLITIRSLESMEIGVEEHGTVMRIGL